MKKYIKIQSAGIIDPQAFSLLGASTKRQDNTKIGFFGSGLKYSIAYLLRNEIPFKVFAEYRPIYFGTRKTNFRETSFDVITINNRQTSMTTEMGMDWEAWFVLREIYCNAIDEGDSSISIVNKCDCLPVEDKTVFYIEMNDKFQELFNDWNLYFSEKREDLVCHDAEFNQIYAGGDKLIIYRKGIRCHYLPQQKCSFNYDMSWTEINESRTIKDDWDFKWKLRKYLQQITDKKIITHLYNTICNTWEKNFEWSSGSEYFSEEWLDCLQRKTLVPYENAGYWDETVRETPTVYITLPSILIEGLKSRFLDKVRVIGDVEGVKSVGDLRVIETLTKKESFLMEEALGFLKKADYSVKYPIVIVEFLRKERLGQAKDGKILLSNKLFDKGRKDIVACIIEEQEHLETGFDDESRAFQTHFIKKYVTELENKTGMYL